MIIFYCSYFRQSMKIYCLTIAEGTIFLRTLYKEIQKKNLGKDIN